MVKQVLLFLFIFFSLESHAQKKDVRFKFVDPWANYQLIS